MSGIANPSQTNPDRSADEVSIRVGATDFQGWQSLAITRSCEVMPNSFSLTASTEFMQSPEALAGTQPGQACTILIGKDTVITGWIDRRTISADARSHQVVISGRGITRNLIDCSANLGSLPGEIPSMISAINTLDLAQRLSAAYKIKVRQVPADRGPAIPSFSASLGETPYQIIESVARYAGFLVYEDQDGILVLDRVGTKMHDSGFAMPGNIEAINGDRSVDGRFSEYTVVWNSVDGLQQLGNKLNQRADKKGSGAELVHESTWFTLRPGDGL